MDSEYLFHFRSPFFLLAFGRLHFNLRSIQTRTGHRQEYNNDLKEVVKNCVAVISVFSLLQRLTPMIIHAFVFSPFRSGEACIHTTMPSTMKRSCR